MALSIVQRAIIAHVEDDPGCTRGAVATATAHGQGPSTIRERMRTIAQLIERGMITDRNAKARHPGPASRLYTTAAGRRELLS